MMAPVKTCLRLPGRSGRGHPLSGTRETWLAPFDSIGAERILTLPASVAIRF